MPSTMTPSFAAALIVANDMNIMFRKDRSRSLSELNPFPVMASWGGILQVNDWGSERYEDVEYKVIVLDTTIDTCDIAAYVKAEDSHVTVETKVCEICAVVTCDMPSFSDYSPESVMSELQYVLRFEDVDNIFMTAVKRALMLKCMMLAEYPVEVVIESIAKVRVKVNMQTEYGSSTGNIKTIWATMGDSGVFNEVIQY